MCHLIVTDRQTDGRRNRQTGRSYLELVALDDPLVVRVSEYVSLSLHMCHLVMTDRQTQRQTEKKTDRQTNRQTDRSYLE